MKLFLSMIVLVALGGQLAAQEFAVEKQTANTLFLVEPGCTCGPDCDCGPGCDCGHYKMGDVSTDCQNGSCKITSESRPCQSCGSSTGHCQSGGECHKARFHRCKKVLARCRQGRCCRR